MHGVTMKFNQQFNVQYL